MESIAELLSANNYIAYRLSVVAFCFAAFVLWFRWEYRRRVIRWDPAQDIVADTRTGEYHDIDCRLAETIPKQHQMLLSDEETAEREGFHPCKFCLKCTIPYDD